MPIYALIAAMHKNVLRRTLNSHPGALHGHCRRLNQPRPRYPSRQSELESERSQYEAVWEQVAEFCDPDAPHIWSGRRTGSPDSQAERQERRGARVYANHQLVAALEKAARAEGWAVSATLPISHSGSIEGDWLSRLLSPVTKLLDWRHR
ncbi:hypothetical protein NKG99_29705 [Mesorhizobium sp. M1409]|uniref:hypothetical protein n=1 Tax=unclassified Mesorhizobium TaxID=325217 RepID=UPI0033396852